MKQNQNKGFLLIEVIVSLMISMMIFTSIYSCFNLIRDLKSDTNYIQDRIGLYQLKQYLLLVSKLRVNGEYLEFEYNFDSYTIEIINNKLIRHPGTVIYLSNIDDVYFSGDWRDLTMEFTRGEQSYEFRLR